MDSSPCPYCALRRAAPGCGRSWASQRPGSSGTWKWPPTGDGPSETRRWWPAAGPRREGRPSAPPGHLKSEREFQIQTMSVGWTYEKGCRAFYFIYYRFVLTKIMKLATWSQSASFKSDDVGGLNLWKRLPGPLFHLLSICFNKNYEVCSSENCGLLTFMKWGITGKR